MEYNFENLEKLRNEVLNSNLNDDTKKIVIESLNEVFFNKAREQQEIEDNISFYHKK